MSDVMSVRLHLSGIRVRGVGVDSVDRLEVESNRLGSGRGAASAGSSVDGCGTGERSGFVTLG